MTEQFLFEQQGFVWPAARIEICGPLGAGKSTLVNLLAHYGATPLYEPVEQHPFLAKFYEDPPRYALETLIHFVTHYMHMVKVHSPLTTTMVVDSGLPLRRTYHEVGTTDPTERLIGDDLMNGIAALLPPADLYIHLTASTDELMERIRRRGRDIEADVPSSYVDALNRTLDHQMELVSEQSRILSLRVTDLKGLTDPISIRPIIAHIHAALMSALEAKGKAPAHPHVHLHKTVAA